jgi:Histidine kinase-like ATPase domain
VTADLARPAGASAVPGAGISALADAAAAAPATLPGWQGTLPGWQGTLPVWQGTLPGTAESVALARRFVRAVLPGCPRAEDLALAATELAANAVRWSAAGESGTFTVTVRSAPRRARVEVTDPGPATRPAGPGNGWGLGIVAAVTDQHGTCHGPRARTSWAEATWAEAPCAEAAQAEATRPGEMPAEH